MVEREVERPQDVEQGQWKTLRGSGPKRQWKTLMGSGKPAGKIEKEKELSLRACMITNVKTYIQEKQERES